MVVPFWGGATHLMGPVGHRTQNVHFSTHLRQLKGYSGFTDLIKNLSIGVEYGVLHTLVWLFEYVTDLPFAGLKGANFWDVKQFTSFFLTPQILEFWAVNWHRYVLICEFAQFFCFFFLFASSIRAMTIRVFWQKRNHPFTAWKVNNCNGMSFGNL